MYDYIVWHKCTLVDTRGLNEVRSDQKRGQEEQQNQGHGEESPELVEQDVGVVRSPEKEKQK